MAAIPKALREAIHEMLKPEHVRMYGRMQRFTQKESSTDRARYYTIPIREGPPVRLSIVRDDYRGLPIAKPSEVIWGMGEYGRKPPEKTKRARLALEAMRGVREAMMYDAKRYKPPRYSFEPTTRSRADLYDAMMKRDAKAMGYEPTLITRANRTMRRFLPDDASLPWLYRDMYKRRSPLRSALADLLSPTVPAALALDAAEDENG